MLLGVHAIYFYQYIVRCQAKLDISVILDSAVTLCAAAAAVFLWLSEKEKSLGSLDLIAGYLACSLFRGILLEQSDQNSLEIEADYLLKSRALLEAIWLVQIFLGRKIYSYHDVESSSTAEEAAGLLGQAFLYWILPVLREGYSAALKLEDLPRLDDQFSSGTLRQKAAENWHATCKLLSDYLVFSLIFRLEIV